MGAGTVKYNSTIDKMQAVKRLAREIRRDLGVEIQEDRLMDFLKRKFRRISLFAHVVHGTK